MLRQFHLSADIHTEKADTRGIVLVNTFAALGECVPCVL